MELFTSSPRFCSLETLSCGSTNVNPALSPIRVPVWLVLWTSTGFWKEIKRMFFAAEPSADPAVPVEVTYRAAMGKFSEPEVRHSLGRRSDARVSSRASPEGVMRCRGVVRGSVEMNLSVVLCDGGHNVGINATLVPHQHRRYSFCQPSTTMTHQCYCISDTKQSSGQLHRTISDRMSGVASQWTIVWEDVYV